MRNIKLREDAYWYCPRCGFKEKLGSNYYTRCPRCGHLLHIIYDNDKQRRLFSLLSSRLDASSLDILEELLPISGAEKIGEGNTPLVKLPLRISSRRTNLYAKLEYLNPSGSFKDRSASLVLAYLKSLGYSEVVEDTSGNTGISIALYSNVYGMKPTIVMPASAPLGKKRLARKLGAKVILAESRAKARLEAETVANRKKRSANGLYKSWKKEKHVAYVDHLSSPFFIEGAKQITYESVFLNKLFKAASVVDAIVLPVGSGGLFLGIYYSFLDLYENGIIKSFPQFYAVQGCQVSPVYEALFGRKPLCGVSDLADGLMVEAPPRREEIIQAIKRSSGGVIVVNNREIKWALRYAWRHGFIIEPSSATVISAIRKLVQEGVIERGNIFTVFTGSGLKT